LGDTGTIGGKALRFSDPCKH